MKKAFLIISTGFIILYSCSKDSGGNGGGGGGTTLNCATVTNKAFALDVAPIIASACATNSGCHATGSGNGPGPLTTYSQIFAARSSIRSSVNAGTMPKNSSITTAQKNSILCWIDSGAPNN